MPLAEAMKSRGLTDETLAQLVGVSRPTITRIRNGTRRPSINVAAKLERLTGISASAFAEAEA